PAGSAPVGGGAELRRRGRGGGAARPRRGAGARGGRRGRRRRPRPPRGARRGRRGDRRGGRRARTAAHRRRVRARRRGGAALMWPAVLVASAGCYLLKVAGLSVPERWLADRRVQRVAGLLPVALLAALI